MRRFVLNWSECREMGVSLENGIMRKTFLALALVTAPVAAQAAPLTVDTLQSPEVVGSANLSFFGGAFGFFDLGASLGAQSGISVVLNYNTTAQTGAFTAAVPLTTTNILQGEAIDFGFDFDDQGEDLIQILFNTTAGSQANDFGGTSGGQCLAELTGEFGDRLANFTSGLSSLSVKPVRDDTGVIPLPATGALMLGALGVLALRRRR